MESEFNNQVQYSMATLMQNIKNLGSPALLFSHGSDITLPVQYIFQSFRSRRIEDLNPGSRIQDPGGDLYLLIKQSVV